MLRSSNKQCPCILFTVRNEADGVKSDKGKYLQIEKQLTRFWNSGDNATWIFGNITSKLDKIRRMDEISVMF